MIKGRETGILKARGKNLKRQDLNKSSLYKSVREYYTDKVLIFRVI